MARNLRERFCEARRLPEKKFRRKLLLECAYHPALCLLLYAIFPRVIRTDLDLISKVGRCRSLSELEEAVLGFQRLNRREQSSFRMRTRLRISGQKLLNRLAKLFREPILVPMRETGAEPSWR